MKDICFTKCCGFLSYINNNQPCPLPPETPLPSPFPSHPSRLSQGPWLSGMGWLRAFGIAQLFLWNMKALVWSSSCFQMALSLILGWEDRNFKMFHLWCVTDFYFQITCTIIWNQANCSLPPAKLWPRKTTHRHSSSCVVCDGAAPALLCAWGELTKREVWACWGEDWQLEGR